MKESNSKKVTDEIQVANDSTDNQLSVAVPIEERFGLSLDCLTDEQALALRNRMIQSCIELKIDTIAAQNQTVISSEEMNRTVQIANHLSQIKSDSVVSSKHKTATGNAEIKVSNYQSSGMWIVGGIIGVVLLLLLLARGL